MDLKDGLAQLQNHLGELETAARKLDNQNFADLIKSARGRLSQAADHPDVEAVGELLRKDMHGEEEQLPFDRTPGTVKPSLNPGSGVGGAPFDPKSFDPAMGA